MSKSFLKLSMIAAAFVLIFSACKKDETTTHKVAILFPVEGSARWPAEGAEIAKDLKAKGYEITTGVADDETTSLASVNGLKGKGIKVVLIASGSTDSQTVNKALSELKAEGAKIICYDRLQQNTDAVDLCITASSVAIGKLMGQALASLPANAKIEIVGGSKHDKNAKELFDGSWSEVGAKVNAGTYIIPSGRKTFDEVVTNGWNAIDGKSYFESVLATYYADGTLPDAIIASSDVIAEGVIAAMEARGSVAKYPILTGQDNTPTSRLLIVAGKQTMTVDKNPLKYVESAVIAVDALANGKNVTTTAKKNNGTVDVPLMEVPVTAIYKGDIK